MSYYYSSILISIPNIRCISASVLSISWSRALRFLSFQSRLCRIGTPFWNCCAVVSKSVCQPFVYLVTLSQHDFYAIQILYCHTKLNYLWANIINRNEMRVNYTQNPKDLTQILYIIFNFAVFLDIFDNSI